MADRPVEPLKDPATSGQTIVVPEMTVDQKLWLANKRLQAVAAIHQPNKHFPYYCVHCRRPMPCQTARALVLGVEDDQ